MIGGYDLQKAVYNALSGSAALTALLGSGKVYDYPPDGTATPYVTIGDDELAVWDTMGTNGSNALVTVHTWTSEEGRSKVKQVMAAVYTALHEAPLTITGYDHAGTVGEFSNVFREADGVTQHGVQRFRVYLRKQ